MLEQERQVRERPVTPKDARLDHIYPGLGYPLHVGSVAYCGWVKQVPWSGRVWNGDVDGKLCVVCAELARGQDT